MQHKSYYVVSEEGAAIRLTQTTEPTADQKLGAERMFSRQKRAGYIVEVEGDLERPTGMKVIGSIATPTRSGEDVLRALRERNAPKRGTR